MNGWNLISKGEIKLVEKSETIQGEDFVKVKIVKNLLTNIDLQLFKGQIPAEYPITLGNTAVGIVSETAGENVYFKRGDRVVIAPQLPCGNCISCKQGAPEKCKNIKTMGVNAEGLLKKFAVLPKENLYLLPDKITDEEAVYITVIAYCLSTLDFVTMDRGSFLAVGSADLFGNILAQLALYYQAIPIVIDKSQANLDLSKKNGIYYNFLNDENLSKMVLQSTSGNMASAFIYLANKSCSALDGLRIIKHGGELILTSTNIYMEGDVSIPLRSLVKTGAKVIPVSTISGNIETAINLLANQNIRIDGLFGEKIGFAEVGAHLSKENCDLSFPTIVSID